MNNKSPVYLIDGSGYIFRAFYAVPGLTNSAGFPTGGLFAFTKMLVNLIKELQSPHVVVAFDHSKQTFRTELYQEYKQNRISPPDDLIKQMPYFRDIVRALGLPLLEKQGFEADDLIGTLAIRLKSFGHPVTIISGDKDFMQLVAPEISIYEPMHKKHIQREEVIAKFGVPPEQVIDILALMGDSSDNIPGVSGVGPKTAAQLVQKFGSVENILTQIDLIEQSQDIRGRQKLAATLRVEAGLATISKQLATIMTSAPVELCGKEVNVADVSDEEILAGMRCGEPDAMRLAELSHQFEFESLFKDLPKVAFSAMDATANATGDAAYTLIGPDRYDEILKKLEAAEKTAFDLETTSLNTLDTKVLGVSFCCAAEEAFYISIGAAGQDQAANWEAFKEKFKPWFEDSQYKKLAQNGKFDLKVLARNGVQLQGFVFDSMIAAYLIAPDAVSYNLTVLARDYLSRGVVEFDEVTKGSLDFSSVSLEDATRYACQDAHYVFLLEAILTPRMQEAGLTRVFSEIEMPLVDVLAKMELTGIALDIEFLKNLSQEFGGRLETIEQEIYQIAGGLFNINSPKQLQDILFGKLALPTKGLKKTKTGISTDQSVLEQLAEHHPLPAKILEYRGLYKLKSTYIDALPAAVSPVTNRLHTSFNQAVAGTGRLSSSDPNLQNIPIQGDEGKKIREAFIAPAGKVLISADYSQIELRLLAHLSSDRAMIAAFKNNEDIHAQTAREIFSVPPLFKPTPDQRRLGKTINFGIVYGMGAYSLARNLGISVREATSYIEKYFQHFSNVRTYFDALQANAERQGFVTTMFGRRRVLKDLDNSGRDQNFAVRAAMNAPIQGSAADIIKLAMVKIQARIENERLPMQLLLQIHDELVFEVDGAHKDNMRGVIRHEMEHVIKIDVPLLVEAGIGHTWGSAHG